MTNLEMAECLTGVFFQDPATEMAPLYGEFESA